MLPSEEYVELSYTGLGRITTPGPDRGSRLTCHGGHGTWLWTPMSQHTAQKH